MSSSHWSARSKKSTKFAIRLGLGLLCATVSASENLWDDAKSLYRAGQFAQARETFTRWGALDPTHLESANFWNNLAACDWKMQKDARAAHGLISGLTAGTWPTTSWENLQLLRQIESRTGIKQGVTQDPSFTLLLLSGNWLQVWLLSLGGWLAALSLASLGLPSQWRRHLRFARYSGVSVGLVFGVLGSAVWGLNHFYIRFGVVSPEIETAEIYRNRELTDNEAGLRLPAGAVIAIRETTEKAVHVLEPIEGWISRTQIAEAGVPLAIQDTRVSVRLR